MTGLAIELDRLGGGNGCIELYNTELQKEKSHII